MIHIIVFVDCIAKNPEIIHARQKVKDAERTVIVATDVSKQVLALDLDPVLLKHKPEVFHLRPTIDIEDTIVPIVLNPV